MNKKLALTLISAFVLSACGGSGSPAPTNVPMQQPPANNQNLKPTSTPTAQPSTPAVTPSTPATPANPGNGGNSGGNNSGNFTPGNGGGPGFIPMPTGSSTPTVVPSVIPTTAPTSAPTAAPTTSPTVAPAPTTAPTPTSAPAPTAVPTAIPTAAPTAAPAPTTGPVSGYEFRERNDIYSNQTTHENYRGAISNQDLNILRIDGKDYQLNVGLKPSKLELKGLLGNAYKDPHKNDGKLNVISENLIDGMRYSRVGSLIFSNNIDSISGKAENTDSHWFYQGITTTDMPSGGRAHYEGNSYMFSYGPTNGDRTYYDTQGAAHFDVDFGAKTIAGKLDNKVQLNYRDLDSLKEGFTFNGKVHGNTFSAKEEQDKIYYHGGFFGPNAEELSGVLRHDDDKVNGYFGAHKQ